jgi:hypothetical protein
LSATKQQIAPEKLAEMLTGVRSHTQNPDDLQQIVDLLTQYPQLIAPVQKHLQQIVSEIQQAVNSVLTKHGATPAK